MSFETKNAIGMVLSIIEIISSTISLICGALGK